MDKGMRGYTKKRLDSPKGISLSYMHIRCKFGGMSIPSLATTILYFIYTKLESLKDLRIT